MAYNIGESISEGLDSALASKEVSAESQKEGPVARAIEKRTAQLPSDIFLWSAGASIVASAILQAFGKRKASLFVGQWVSPFLLLGVYNKIVKVAGHDKTDRSENISTFQ